MASTITPGDSETTNLNKNKSKVPNPELKSMKKPLEDSDCLQTRLGLADAITGADVLKSQHDPEVTLVLPFSCVSYNTTNVDFAAHLSGIINQAILKLHCTETVLDRQGNLINYPVCSNEAGYFEMGPDQGDCILGCSSNIDFANISAKPEAEILKVLWTLCVQVNKGLKLFISCIVLTDSAVAVFQIPHSELRRKMQNVISQMQLVLCLPYSDILEVFFEVPEMCLSMKIKMHGCFFFISDSQNLKDFSSHLKAVLHKWSASTSLPQLGYEEPLLKDFIVQLLQHRQLALNDTGIKGSFAAYILIQDDLKPWDWSEELQPSASHTEVVSSTELKDTNNLHSEVCSVIRPGKEEHSKPLCVPCLLILTAQYLYFIRIDFYIAAKKCLHPEEIARCPFKLEQISLATLLLNPKQGSRTVETGAFWDGHILEFLIGYQLTTAIFVLPHEKFHFLRMFSQLRGSFQGVKSIVVHRSCPDRCYLTKHNTDATDHSPETKSNQPKFKSDLSLSLQYPSETLLQKLTEENQCPFHLSTSPSLHYLAGLKGRAIVECFHNNVAEVENEELRHLIWSSVIFYKSSEIEVTACVMLSTKALYFVLDDTIGEGAEQTGCWKEKSSSNCERDGLLLSFCFVLKLNDLQSIHLGLFDQYFRITGPSAEQTIACLTRDSYTTHTFVQQLMGVLSLLERTPSPEPVELDFYTEFGKKNTGQMENYEIVHSSRVKFIYPSEEEVGDLTFMIAENVQELNLQTSNILLYVLAFQVESLENSLHSCKPPLQPKTLILTSYNMLLFEEDYVSYPLPEFAKEPPQRDKYQLTDTRRIRDLDRVLMGYQTYPQAITFVFDDVQNQDFIGNMMLDHFEHPLNACSADRINHCGTNNEVQWCLFVASPESRERLIALLARQWELLCSRELPVELTG